MAYLASWLYIQTLMTFSQLYIWKKYTRPIKGLQQAVLLKFRASTALVHKSALQLCSKFLFKTQLNCVSNQT